MPTRDINETEPLLRATLTSITDDIPEPSNLGLFCSLLVDSVPGLWTYQSREHLPDRDFLQ